MGQEYARTVLYKNYELVKKITFREFVEQFLTENYMDCTWLKRDYDFIRYHNYQSESVEHHFLLPCVNSIHDVFDMKTFTHYEYSANQRFTTTLHDNYPSDNLFAAFYIAPTKRTVEAFAQSCGSFDKLGDWSGATSFEVVNDISSGGHNIMVRYQGGRAFLAKVYDYKKEVAKYESFHLQQIKTQDDPEHKI